VLAIGAVVEINRRSSYGGADVMRKCVLVAVGVLATTAVPVAGGGEARATGTLNLQGKCGSSPYRPAARLVCQIL